MKTPADQPDIDEQQLASLVGKLADQVARGESLNLETVCQQYPQFECDLRELWGVIVVTQMAASESDRFESQSDSITAEFTPRFDFPCEFAAYTLLEEIGRGGMGIVYRATRRADGQLVAIKMILKGDFATLSDQQRFDAEAQAIAKLDHPSIVPIYEIGEFQGRSFFCMKLIEGVPLSERLMRGPLESHEAAKLLSQISRAIGHAHQQGVLHRDLKPSNILLDNEGRAYVADFGLAKHAESQKTLTKTGAILGTPSYMAPEQAAGARGQLNFTSDVYSLGAILYHTLCGRPPFLGASPVETVLMVLEQDPPALRTLNRQIDRSLEMITMRCLQKPQDLRYARAEDLANDLEAFLNDGFISARIGRFGQVIGNVFRETHHAVVLENWGLLWMWHSLVLLVTSLATEWLFWMKVTTRIEYWLLWTIGLGAWAIVFWVIRRRMGPVTFVERQIAHVWAASMICVILLFPLEHLMGLPVLSLAPLLGAMAGTVFLVKAGILSGSFYIPSVVMFSTSILMAMLPAISMTLFGFTSAACFFFSGLKYYRRRKQNV